VTFERTAVEVELGTKAWLDASIKENKQALI
jgi:hypothetical protein